MKLTCWTWQIYWFVFRPKAAASGSQDNAQNTTASDQVGAFGIGVVAGCWPSIYAPWRDVCVDFLKIYKDVIIINRQDWHIAPLSLCVFCTFPVQQYRRIEACSHQGLLECMIPYVDLTIFHITLLWIVLFDRLHVFARGTDWVSHWKEQQTYTTNIEGYTCIHTRLRTQTWSVCQMNGADVEEGKKSHESSDSDDTIEDSDDDYTRVCARIHWCLYDIRI